MSRMRTLFCVVCMLSLGVAAFGQTLTVQPLEVSGTARPVTSGTVKVPLITWGGDVSTILTQTAGIFKAEGLETELFVENVFPKQAEGVLAGHTPYLRGTMGMVNSAAEAFRKRGIDLVVVYQMTWSSGGDVMVVRPKIRTTADLCNATIALQLYGPHMDYVANILSKSCGSTANVKFKYYADLQLPQQAVEGGKITDPVTAFLKDPSIDAVMAISPDAMVLTSGYKVGTGAAGSVKGARKLLSTQTANRIIADVYAVRSDYYASHRAEVDKFVRALLKGQEALQDLVKGKSGRQAEYRQLLSKSADLLLGSSTATNDVEGLLADCEFVGYGGNVAFFTGKGTTRTFKTLTGEIQKSFAGMGLMTGRVALPDASLDYAALAGGLKYATNVPVAPKFDEKKVEAVVAKQLAVESTSFSDNGVLFEVEINFLPNQSVFPVDQYASDFQKALGIAQTYGGSLVVVEGHTEPLGILKAKQKGENAQVIAQMEQQAKNLSLQRAQGVRDSFLQFAKTQGIAIDKSQYIAVGVGVTKPKFNPPKTEQEWKANMRVLFRIKQVEAESSSFTPLGK